MKSSAGKIQLTGFDDLFHAKDEVEVNGERVQEIPLAELFPFKDHPFHVVDDEKLSVSAAADYISPLSEQEQIDLASVMDKLNVIPVKGQLAKIKEGSKAGTLTITVIESILSTERPAAVQVVIKQARLHQYFPPSYTARQMEEVFVSMLENWKLQQI